MDTWLIIALSILGFLVLIFLYGFLKMKMTGTTSSSENIVHLTDKNFATVVKTGTIIVDFWAEWCGPCRMLIPTMNQLADENKGQFKVGKLNVDEARTIASQYGIRSIPTVIVFKNGKESKRFVGVKPKNVYLNYLQSS